MDEKPSAPASGKMNTMDIDDPLDIMIEQKRREEEVNLNDSLNHINPTKTPSTAENCSVKGHVSFESHSNNLNTLNAHDVSKFDKNDNDN